MRVRTKGTAREISLALDDGVRVDIRINAKGEATIPDKLADEILRRCPGLEPVVKEKATQQPEEVEE